uniref:Uncharacterized protein n=1 Tax=Ditylenchus dipsaci TaxID=166011 RepID=A0A915E3H4_9BILA
MNEFGDPVYQTNVLIDPDLSRTSVHDPAEVIPQNSPANVDYPAQSADIHNPAEMISHKHPVKSPDQVSVSSATDPDLRQRIRELEETLGFHQCKVQINEGVVNSALYPENSPDHLTNDIRVSSQ